MKRIIFWSIALVIALFMSMAAQAQTDSLSMDTTLWYNQTQQLSGAVVKGRLPKTRVKGDAMRTTIAGTILEKAGNVSDMLNKVPSCGSSTRPALSIVVLVLAKSKRHVCDFKIIQQ